MGGFPVLLGQDSPQLEGWTASEKTSSVVAFWWVVLACPCHCQHPAPRASWVACLEWSVRWAHPEAGVVSFWQAGECGLGPSWQGHQAAARGPS